MNENELLEQYKKLFVKFPGTLKRYLTDECNFSKKEIIDLLDRQIKSNQLPLVVPTGKLEQVISNNQRTYVKNANENAQYKAADYMASLVNHTSDDNIVRIVNDCLKIVYSIIGDVYDSKYFEVYVAKMIKDINDTLVKTNSENLNMSLYEEKINYIVNEVVKKITLQSGWNVSNRITSNYVKNLTDISDKLDTVMEQNVSVKK